MSVWLTGKLLSHPHNTIIGSARIKRIVFFIRISPYFSVFTSCMILWPPPRQSGFVAGRDASVALRGGLTLKCAASGLFLLSVCRAWRDGCAVQCRRPRVSGWADPACPRDREACDEVCILTLSYGIDLIFQYHVHDITVAKIGIYIGKSNSSAVDLPIFNLCWVASMEIMP